MDALIERCRGKLGTKMERVVVLLRGGTLPIDDIAKMCGYGTEAALRIAFKKRFGMSMRSWRS